MPAILTNELRVMNSDVFKEALLSKPTYAFFAGTSEWQNENNPPTPIDCTSDKYKAMSEMFGMKRILATDIVSVIPRINWESGVVFDYYDDQVDLINQKNPDTGQFYRFYVVTDDYNVYKCIDNNYGAESTHKPSGTQPTPFETPDGYVWKYMYSITPGDAISFMTTNWMPCYTLKTNDGSAQWASQQEAKAGTIDQIQLNNRGSGYTVQNPPTVVIDGDGVGASAVADVHPVTGELRRVNITNSGSGYTYANISFIASDGQGASARAIVGPRKGHGADPRVELGANYLMVKVVIVGDETGYLPTGISFRVTGIISNPLLQENGVMLELSKGDSHLYKETDIVKGSISGAEGEIVMIDYFNDLVYLKNVDGIFIEEETEQGARIETFQEHNVPMVQLVTDGGNYASNSGEILFISNREKINRVENQTEEIISVLSF